VGGWWGCEFHIVLGSVIAGLSASTGILKETPIKN
jgi:hypothetical protein